MERINFVTPVGRVVAGSVDTPNTTNMQGKPLLTQNGEPRSDYFFAIAVQKGPEADQFRSILGQAAAVAWPGRQYDRPGFSWKVDDGDSIDKDGKPFSERAGYAGCWIFKFSGGFAPRCFKADERGSLQPIPASEVYKGCYVRVSGNTCGNGNTEKPGLYVNHDMVQFIAHGEPIYSGPNPDSVFTQPIGALPQGASHVPVGGTPNYGGGMPGGNPNPQPNYGPGGQPHQQPNYGGGMPGGNPNPNPQPNYGGGMPGGNPNPNPQPNYGPGGQPHQQPNYGGGMPGGQSHQQPNYGPGGNPNPQPNYGPGGQSHQQPNYGPGGQPHQQPNYGGGTPGGNPNPNPNPQPNYGPGGQPHQQPNYDYMRP